MGLPVLWIWTLLVVSSSSWTSADVGQRVLLDQEVRPCMAALTPEGSCTQDDSACPYIFSLPPLTVHLPEKLRELETIMTELQKLQDNVDQLRKMCAGCAAGQSEGVCGRLTDSRYEKLTEDEKESSRMKERTPEGLQEIERDFRRDCGTDPIRGQSDAEAYQKTDTVKDGTSQVKFKVPAAGGIQKEEDLIRERTADRHKKTIDRDKEKDGKWHLKRYEEEKLDNGNKRRISTDVKNKEKSGGCVQRGCHHGKKETENDGIKLSEDHERHTDEEREQLGVEREKEMGVKVERNNEEPKQMGGIGDKEKESEQRDGDGEPTPTKAVEEINFVSVAVTPESTTELTSARPSSSLSGSHVRDIDQGSMVMSVVTNKSPDVTAPTRSRSTDPGPKTSTGFTTSPSSMSGAPATSDPLLNAYTTVFPGAKDHSRWAAKKNISSNIKNVMKPPPGRGPKLGGKHKPGIKPEAQHKLKDSKYDRKVDQGPLPDKRTPNTPADRTSKPVKADRLNFQKVSPKQGRDRTGNPHQTQIPRSPPLSGSGRNLTSHHRPATVSSSGDPESDEMNQNKRRESEKKTEPGGRSKSDRYVPDPKRRQTIERTHKPSPGPKTVQDSTPGKQLIVNRDNKPPNQRLKYRQRIPKLHQKPKPDQLPKPNKKRPTFRTEPKPEVNVKPKTEGTPGSHPGLQILWLDHNLSPTSVADQIPDVDSNKTSHPPEPPTRPPVNSEPTPAEEPALTLKNKTHLDPPQISTTIIGSILKPPSDMPPTPNLEKLISSVTHSPDDPGFNPSSISQHLRTSNGLDSPPEGSTVSSNSRIMSDLRPQTASQPPSIPVTTSPNKIILQSAPPSSDPQSAQPNPPRTVGAGFQTRTLHTGEEPAASETTTPVPSPRARSPSTASSDFRSTTSAPRAPAAESSTPSARELRVKIEQVAAFFNHSLNPSGRPPDRHLKPYRTDSSPPTETSSKDKTVSRVRRDCSDHLLRGETRSGVYLVTPDLRSRSFPVLCDMKLEGGGWTLLQLRRDGSVRFNRTWAEYRSGFGQMDGGEFWLGNNQIHLLTRGRDMVLRVELEDFDGVKGYAQYEQFRVASERMQYRLTVGGYSAGTAGDALRFSKTYDHNNRSFTTPDRDHDQYPSGNCGVYYSSGWWFDACMAANLNGRYYVGRYKGVRDGIFWGTWPSVSAEHYPTNDRLSFKSVRMMIRPKGFAQ